MTWSSWMDSYEEHDDYFFAVHNLIPSTGGIWGQPLFSLKYTSCEDMTREECACTEYEKENVNERGFSGIEYMPGAVWSKIMSAPEDKLMSDSDVDAHIG